MRSASILLAAISASTAVVLGNSVIPAMADPTTQPVLADNSARAAGVSVMIFPPRMVGSTGGGERISQAISEYWGAQLARNPAVGMAVTSHAAPATAGEAVDLGRRAGAAYVVY